MRGPNSLPINAQLDELPTVGLDHGVVQEPATARGARKGGASRGSNLSLYQGKPTDPLQSLRLHVPVPQNDPGHLQAGDKVGQLLEAVHVALRPNTILHVHSNEHEVNASAPDQCWDPLVPVTRRLIRQHALETQWTQTALNHDPSPTSGASSCGHCWAHKGAEASTLPELARLRKFRAHEVVFNSHVDVEI